MGAPFRLRPYQKSAVAAVVSLHEERKERRLLLYLPTGAGKTVIATFLIKALRERSSIRRVLFVAHRREILDQTANTLQAHLPALRIEVEQGERSADQRTDIVVASVQSLVRRKERYDPRSFDLIICDECHRALAPSWGEVIDYFSTHGTERTLLLGMTATPRRTDGKSALDVFQRTAFEISRTDLEDLGYLVPMRYFTVTSELGLDRVKLSGGDFQVGGLSRIMNTAELRAVAVKAWLEQGAGRRTIVFCAGVEHAAQLAADFRALGVAAERVDGKTKGRTELLDRFRHGEIQVLTNYGVLTEGFDDPEVACILMARPTTSPLVYTQCVGRGLRCAPGKHSCTIIDIVDRSTHQLQYDAVQMAGLPTRWRCRGGDPFRQAQSLRGIQVTSPEAFLRIRNASCLEEVQTILMSLPANVVVAGLDGEPVLHYTPAAESVSGTAATEQAQTLLQQARARGAKVTVTEDLVQVSFRRPEADNERYAYLKWHLSRVTGRSVHYLSPKTAAAKPNPRALLKSMLREQCRLTTFEMMPQGDAIRATISGLTGDEVTELAREFQEECGLPLELRGQLSLF